MASFPVDSRSASNDWTRRLTNAKICAENGDEGDVFFLEVTTSPLVSLFITTGKSIKKNSKKKSVSLSFKEQHSSYPTVIETKDEVVRVGYNNFKVVIEEMSDNRKAKKKFKDTTMSEYSDMLREACIDIDSSIRDYHGIVCYVDGNHHNRSIGNLYVLHVCDVMNIMVSSMKNKIPKVVVKSSLLMTIPGDHIKNDLMQTHLRKKNFEFFFAHIDFFYMIYGYYNNHSFVPVRTQVSIHSRVFRKSSFFTNDDHFIRHQKGKLIEFNQNEKRSESKLIYKSI